MGLDWYFGDVERLEKDLAQSKAQEQRGSAINESLGIMNDDVNERLTELRRTCSAQEALILALRKENSDLRAQLETEHQR